VAVLDNLSTGRLENIRHLTGHPGFSFTRGDIQDEGLFAALVDACDLVCHLAAAVGVKLVMEKPLQTLVTNVQGTQVVLAQASRSKRKVLLASSSEVYGGACQAPFREEDGLQIGASTNVRWGYACSKALDEFLALAYWREQRLPAVVVRLFNTVGPRQTGRYGMVVPTFVKQALAGRPLTVHGDGRQARCFTHVGDVVRTLVQLADHPDAVGQVFNVGSDTEVTIVELARQVRQETGSRSEIRFVPYRQAYGQDFEDVARRVPDTTKVRTLLGFRPTHTLRDILRAVIAYQRDQPTALDAVSLPA
jgi:UDP-glucose 4-epimerase